jgi:hypothetical protein
MSQVVISRGSGESMFAIDNLVLFRIWSLA